MRGRVVWRRVLVGRKSVSRLEEGWVACLLATAARVDPLADLKVLLQAGQVVQLVRQADFPQVRWAGLQVFAAHLPYRHL